MYRRGVQRSRARQFPIEFNACAYAAFLYVFEQREEDEEEDMLEMMETLFQAFLESPTEIDL